MKKALLVVGCLYLLSIAAFPFAEFVQRLQGGRYPGTAEQAGRIYLMGQAAHVRDTLKSYVNDHDGAWPDSLADLVREKLVNAESLRYPRVEDLPDRRDILKMHDFVEWIYLKPDASAPERPILVAPLPCRSSMGRILPKPSRIVVARNGKITNTDNTQIEPILRRLPPLHQSTGTP